ncbi:protein RESTRICTED TEV MOVEMENT 2-like [Herrania umbratica]|uniref:Protein RESTRICTED TEV MOVEMENT 2-like n=1 Tax=Herrania umbratica TaxID=108875 RepID=A0A6J0ZQU0_9ROSI|nr:protein RESTRICTED TEV MOVEMENT 2-like [Herrania umbratica]
MAGRTRTNVSATVYEDFQPIWEQKEEQGANILLVHLPGFEKEQIVVTYVDSSRTIKLQGERSLEKNKRSRVNQSLPVPQNCVVGKIQGSFRNGVLTITMPKQTITQPSSVDDAKPTNETTPPKATRDQKAMKHPKETTAPKPASPSTSGFEKPRDEKLPPPQTPQKAITEPKTPKGTKITPSRAAPSPSTLGERQANGKKVDALQPSKQQEETQKKVAPTATTTKQPEEKSAAGSTAEIVEKTGESKVGLGTVAKEKKDSAMSGSHIPKLPEKKKKDNKGAGVVEGKAKEGGSFMAKAKEMKGMDTLMKSVKRLATEDYEDRQMLINIGVSVLVIVALGAYITYAYRSSGKSKG